MDQIISLAKRRGFLYPGSDVYGGLAGFIDYGPLGLALKNNIKQLWWKLFVTDREDVYGLDAALIMRPEVWQASGHVAGFADPLVTCEKCARRFRQDELKDGTVCPDCGGKLGAPRQFNMMFQTAVGAVTDSAGTAYLRPETAQGIFVNFKNIVDSFHPKLPFGIAQIGKAFRNEITPRDFLFRLREFEQMELEYFVKPGEWEASFTEWQGVMRNFIAALGLPASKVHELEVPAEDRAHYSKRTVDFEFDYPFGRKELYGLAYRTDFDLRQHQEFSKQDLSYFDEEAKERLVPHVIEPSLGVERTLLAVLYSAYCEDELGGEKRIVLKLPKVLAPIKAAVFPLLRNKSELVGKAREVYQLLKKANPAIIFDDNGNIGKRYRRQDEIGTPYCVTIDFDTLENNTVTVRDRDTGEQQRVVIKDLTDFTGVLG